MPFSRSSHHAFSARRALAAEVERLAVELRGPVVGRIEDALAALVTGEGFPPGLVTELLLAAQSDGEGRLPRIRPVLVHLAAQVGAAGPDAHAAQEVAMVAELLQAAIVIHDAALGRQHGRRRRAARRVLRGATHWVGGNHLTLRALEIARRAPAPEVLGDALDALREITEAQALASGLGDRLATPREVLQHAASHEGAVTAFACRAGGHLGRVELPVVARLGRYGRHTGVAWHLAGDLAAFETGQRAWLVKRAEAGRFVYPVAWAAEREPEVGAWWQRLGAEPDEALADRVAEAVRGVGGLVAGREALVGETWSARRALVAVPEGPARDAMDRLVAALASAA